MCTRWAKHAGRLATRRWCPPSFQSLKDQGADDIIVFVGGVIPAQDYEHPYEAGVKGIYGPGNPYPRQREGRAGADSQGCWSLSTNEP